MNTSNTGEIYIQNAGLVLISAYLPQMFSALKLMKNDAFIDITAQERAVHLLQYAVNCSETSPEYQLILNKIICGYDTGRSLSRGIEITLEEIGVIDSLLNAMIANWKELGNTSVAGLRESFFQREGRLILIENEWHLKIEERGYDILLETLPWAYSVIKHQWMAKIIYIDWR